MCLVRTCSVLRVGARGQSVAFFLVTRSLFCVISFIHSERRTFESSPSVSLGHRKRQPTMKPDHENNYERLDQTQISSNVGYGVVLISFLSLQGLRVFVKRYATPASVGEKNRWKWQNIQLSWCHSTITGLGSLYW